LTRDAHCPLCRSETDSLLRLRFNSKLNLPTEPEIRHCASDNFLFVSSGSQHAYDEYYKSLVNDSYHAELSGGSLHSPISRLQQAKLVEALDGFFVQNRKVLDFGCGEASLLIELAGEFPSSFFVGFDPGPAARIGSNKASLLGLSNLTIANQEETTKHGPYDLVILSQVAEHLLDFKLLKKLDSLLTADGLLYIEVPNSLLYEKHNRQEFLYYFDRLHVNHFTPQSLARLAESFNFFSVAHFEYTFPYRDGGEYPALGMLFSKSRHCDAISSPRILDTANRYIFQEKQRARAVAAQFDKGEGTLVWGAGDNFFRSVENGGPLSDLTNMVVLDRKRPDLPS